MKLSRQAQSNIAWRIAHLGLSNLEFARRLGYDSVARWIHAVRNPTLDEDRPEFLEADRNSELLSAVLSCPRELGGNANDFQTGCMAIAAEREARIMTQETLRKRIASVDRRLHKLNCRQNSAIVRGIIVNILALVIGIVIGGAMPPRNAWPVVVEKQWRWLKGYELPDFYRGERLTTTTRETLPPTAIPQAILPERIGQ